MVVGWEGREQRTWVVVEFTPVDAGTHVRLTHLGSGPEEHWTETRDYFQSAWPRVLLQFLRSLEGTG